MDNFVVVVSFQTKLDALFDAVEESLVDGFTLKPSNQLIQCATPIVGQIKTCNKEFIFVEIPEAEHRKYVQNHPDRVYDIFFHVNRGPFQLQHYALHWLVKHQLFQQFVNSQAYDCDGWNFDVRSAAAEPNYSFRFELAAMPWK